MNYNQAIEALVNNTRVVCQKAWDQGYRAGVLDAERRAEPPDPTFGRSLNPYSPDTASARLGAR